VSILRNHQVRVQEVKHWVGDRSVESHGARKDNARLAEAIAKAAGMTRREAGIWIPTPDKGAGSVYAGVALVNGLFREDRMFIDPAGCPELVGSIQRWEGHRKDPAKDLIDAARYGVEKLIDYREVAPPRSYLAG